MFIASLTLSPACSPAPDSAPHLLLITLDTTNPEALGIHGGDSETSPSLDRLARTSVVFENARTVAPLTTPAHASMLTGLYPPRHTVRANSATTLPDSAETLAEILQDHGWRTAAFVSAFVLNREYGLDQGFEIYDASFEVSGALTAYPEHSAQEVTDRAIAWLSQQSAASPWFLWVHYFSPHTPYSPPVKFLKTEDDNPYLGEVAYMDDEIGRLLHHLDRADCWSETSVVVVGDHGEALGRHGEDTHGAFVFDSTLRVPFLVHRAGSTTGSRITSPISVADVLPTVLGLAGIPVPDGLDGRDVLQPLEDSRTVYFESYLGHLAWGWSPIAGMVDDSHKFIQSSTPELYELGSDPDETTNRVNQDSETVAQLRIALADVFDRPSLPRESRSADAREVDALKALGYPASGAEESPSPLDPTDRPSPHQRVRAYAQYQRARGLFDRGLFEDAVALLEPLLSENDSNPALWFAYGAAVASVGRFEEAIPALQRAVQLRPQEFFAAFGMLARCHQELGQLEAAIDHYRRALETEPDPRPFIEPYVSLLEQLGRHEEAARFLQELR